MVSRQGHKLSCRKIWDVHLHASVPDISIRGYWASGSHYYRKSSHFWQIKLLLSESFNFIYVGQAIWTPHRGGILDLGSDQILWTVSWGMSWCLVRIILRMKPCVLFASVSHFRYGSSPRYLAWSTAWRTWPWRIYKCLMGCLERFYNIWSKSEEFGISDKLKPWPWTTDHSKAAVLVMFVLCRILWNVLF